MSKEFKIYTKAGDTGQTSLIGGSRVAKHDLQVEAYGTIDELKSYTGLVYDFVDDLLTKKNLLIIIENLFITESLVACDSYESKLRMPQLKEADVLFLESEIDRMTLSLAPLHSFILPGGHPLVSHCHVARTICRRAERAYLRFAETHDTDELVLKFLNRLSDYYFTLARYAAKLMEVDELLWLPKKTKK
jgi:cob(I)alamin adenosyltransferase